MTALHEFFTFPWIKILFQDYLYQLDLPKQTDEPNILKSFRAYVKDAYDGGSFLLLNDGFNEVRAKLLPECKAYLRERYPSFCYSKGDSLCKFLIVVQDYQFIVS